MSKGLLLLDVDGPLNPYGGTNKPRQQAGYRPHRLLDYKVWLRRDMGSDLLQLAADADLEMVWATTWEHEANRLIGPRLGLPELPVIEFRNAANWKFDAVRDYAGDRPLAWLDDDFRLFPEPRALFTQQRDGISTLLQLVSPKWGLLPEDFEAVRAWAALLEDDHA